MEKSLVKIHASWATAFAAALFVGSQFPKVSNSSSSPRATGQSDRTIATSGGGSGSGVAGTDSDKSSGRSSTRSGGQSGGSAVDLLSDIFGGSTLSAAGLEGLAAEALRDPNPVKRRLAFTKLLEGMTPENAALIRDQLVELRAGGQEWRDFNYAWGAIAGQDAFDQALLADRKDLGSLMTGWAAANPDGAMALLDRLPENLEKQRGEFENSIVSGLADRDRDFAAAYVGQLAEGGRKDAHRLMDIVASEALRKDGPEASAAWSESLADGPLKGAAMNRIAGSFAREDPEAAASWVEKFATADYAARAVAEVGEEWAEKDPINAVTWLDRLPEGEGQRAGLGSAFGDWEDRDPVAAGEYLLSMSPSPKRDSAIKGFADGYAWQDPETAIAWAQDISDPNMRNSSLARVGQAYFRRDPDSAKVWLESSGLPTEVQAEIQKPRDRRR